MSKQWLIKNKNGNILGPYSEKEIGFHIEEGKFKGEELLSSYPVGKWKPISSQPFFYEKILAKLNEQNKSAPPSEKFKSIEQSSTAKGSLGDEIIEPTRIVDPRDKDSSTKKMEKKKRVKIKLSEKFKKDVLSEEENSEIIEMEDIKDKFIDRLKISLKTPVLILIGLSIAAFAFLFQDKENRSEKKIRLLPIRKTIKPWTNKELKSKLQNGMKAYLSGTVSNYLNAQSQYVQILEGHPDKVEIYSYLCLVYLEIWPFAYQDTKDQNALKRALNLVSKKNPSGIYSDLCRSVQALIDKNPEKSLRITNNVLDEAENKVSLFFYYLKAKALKALNRTIEANNYLESVYQLQQEWIAPYMLGAQIFYEKKQYDLSAKLYQKVLHLFPKHNSAGLKMGILEYKYFKKYNNSERRLKSILLDLNEPIKPDILIEAYIALANIYLKQNNRSEVVKYANKAYALYPNHPDVMNLKQKLGQEGDFKDTQVKSWALIYKGDLLVNQGNCSKALENFKKAYTADNKRNAPAALKAAQCYWQMGFSGQAIRWLRRSINADSKMIEAYFLLSDYLSALYDFESAKEILAAVKNKQPSNFDLFKAYALLSFRQEQYTATVAYAKRSLDFYTSDTEVYILLSKAHRALNESHKAFSYAERAIQEDMNNISAQITYALSLQLAYNERKTIKYLKDLVSHFPRITDYSQALGKFYFELNMYEEAEAIFKGIIEKNKNFKPAYIFLGKIYSNLSDKEGSRTGEKYEKALQYFLEASLLDISDPEPIFFTAQTYMNHKEHQMAENEFEKVLQMNPNYPLIHYYIGKINFLQEGEENLEKALKYAKTQSAKNPNHYLPYKLAGDIYRVISQGAFEDPQERLATYELCTKEYQKALKYLKTDTETSIGLIECYKGSGNMDSALQLALQLVKEEGLSGYPQFYKEIGSIFEAKNQYEKARAYYSTYFSLIPGAEDRKIIETRINKLIDEKNKLTATEKETKK